MTRLIRNINGFLIGFLMVVLLAWCSSANADGTSGTDVDVDVGVGVGTTVNTDIAGDALDIVGGKSFAIGGSSFDVDINQCMASKATNIVVVGWQTLKENPTCIADGLDARGNHDAAARIRCTHVDTIASSYTNFKQCVSSVTMKPVGQPPPTSAASAPDRDEEYYEERRAREDARIAAVTEVMNEISLLKQQRARDVRASQERKAEEAEYAQQMIEQIQQIEEPPGDK